MKIIIIAAFCALALNSCMFFSKTKGKAQISSDTIPSIRGVSPPYTTDCENPMPQPSREVVQKNYPQAAAIPGRPGFVYSPYSQRVIDVVDIAAGTLVNEPQSPLCAKKYFYVP